MKMFDLTLISYLKGNKNVVYSMAQK